MSTTAGTATDLSPSVGEGNLPLTQKGTMENLYIIDITPHPAEFALKVTVSMDEMSSTKATMWFSFRTGQLELQDHDFPGIETEVVERVKFLTIYEMARDVYSRRKEKEAKFKEDETFFTVPVSPLTDSVE